ncbi:MAG: hypothetical protein K2W95_13320 [Candidatus Obscuribacterales bacterium]|nr:hypothetical protein [Candidatus Obscuribacterales bacterium]
MKPIIIGVLTPASKQQGTRVFGCLMSALLVAASCPVFGESTLDTNTSFFDTTDKSFVSKFLPAGSYMPVSEVKPGMTGYGLSVFQGMKVEKFDVQVIGTVKKFLNGRDAILVKLGGPAMANNNVIRGMSGSPIYINEKLIGAVSFGFDFQKDPIAGVTPVVDMLDSLADNTERTPISKLNLTPLEIAKGNGNGSMIVPSAAGGLKPVPLLSPIGLSGFSARAEKFLSTQFGEYGLQVSSGAAGGTNPGLSTATVAAAAKEMKPGSAASVLLSSGDFTSAGTGTVTARFGNKVIAFGHPMMSAGAVDFPLSTAFVHKVISSLSVSFKLASPVTEIGTLTADRPWSVGGQIGRTPKMIPVSFSVVDEMRKIKRTFNCKVVDHPQMTPALLAATTMSAIDATHQFSGPYVAKVNSVVEADGIEPIARQDCFGSNITPHSLFEQLFSMMMGDPIAAYVHRTANSIVDNDYQRASIKSFKLKITLQDGRETANIDRVYVEKPYAAPGEQVKVMCVLKPYNKPQRTETLSFQIPRDAPDGNLPIAVSGGDQIDYVRSRLGISDPEPESLKEIADDIRRQSRGDQLELVAGLPEQTLLIGSTKIIDPPSHWAKVLFSNRHTNGPRIVKRELRTSKLTEYLLSGSHIVTVEVRSHDRAGARSVPAMMPGRLGGDDPMMTETARKTLGASSQYKNRSQSGLVPALQGAVSGSSSTQTSSTTSSSSSTTSKTASATGLFAPKVKGYPHTRLHQIWRQETEEDFHDGKNEGTTVDSWGRVGPGLNNVSTKALNPEQEVWSGVWSNGYFYFSTASSVWRWKGDDSAIELVADLDAKIVPSLAVDSKGTVYAACVPSGEVVAVTGGRKTVFKSPDGLVTTLAVDDKDVLYVGTASNGRVYKVDKGVSTQLFDSGQAHITALFFSTHDGKLYVGTGERGAVYSVDRTTGKARALYQSNDHIVTGVVRTRKGDLYVSCASQGRLVRVLPSGEAQSLASSEAFYTLHYDAQNDLVFAGDAEGDITMACIETTTEQPYFIPVSHTEQESVLALASNGSKLFAGTSNLSLLKSFAISSSTQPKYESKVKDAGRTADWARIRLSGPFTEVPEKTIGAVLKVETRTGETSKADETWSAWSGTTFDGESFKLTSPAGRFLQYRLTWLTPSNGTTPGQTGPQIGRVDVVYLPKDVAPAFSSISLKAGGSVSGKQDVAIVGTDADGDNMLCSIDVSADGGQTWQNMIADLRPKNAKKVSSSKDSTKDAVKESSSKDKESKDAKDSKDSKTGKESPKDPKDAVKDGAKDSEKGKGNTKDSTGGGASDSSRKPDSKEGKQKQSGSTSDRSAIRLQDANDNDDANKSGEKSEDDSKSEDSKSDEKKDDDSSKEEDKSDKKDSDSDKKDKDEKKKSKKSGKSSATSDPVGSSSSKSEAGGSSTETFAHNWETSKYKDGAYILKFTLDDRLSNPSDHQKTINVRAVVVDNTAPEIELIDCKRTGTDKVECKVTARDKSTPIANAIYRIDDGEFFALAVKPHSLDGLSAVLFVPDLKCGAGSHKIEVKVSDRAGNTATKTTSIK